jgi:hypothetical protein
MEDKGSKILAQALIQNKSITSLNLSILYTNIPFIASNSIGEIGAEHLAKALIQNKTITSFDFGILYT